MKLWQIRKEMILKMALTVFVLLFFLGRLDCEELTVQQAKDVTLKCYGHNDTNIMLSWQKPDLQSEYYVFYFSDEQIHKDKQHESFKNRVEQKEIEIKNGNFSVILKNVTMNDSVKYECYAGYQRQRPQLLKSINLEVKEEGQPGGDTEDGGKEDGPAGLNVCHFLLLAAVVAFSVTFKKLKAQQKQNYYKPPAEQIVERFQIS